MKNEIGKGRKSKRRPTGVKGNASVATTTRNVASIRYFPGRLLKKGFRLRMTSTISEAETTDSRNQPVRNCSGVACKTNSKHGRM